MSPPDAVGFASAKTVRPPRRGKAETASAISIYLPSGMSMGGQLGRREQTLQATLVGAHTGGLQPRETGWRKFRWSRWVVDYVHHGQQPQRVGGGRKFARLSGVAALYRPGTWYHEWHDANGAIDESRILFRLSGELEKNFNALTARGGWCHFRDPDHAVADRLRKIGKLLFHRRPGFAVLAQGVFLELLGLLATTSLVGPHLRVVQIVTGVQNGPDLHARVERYILDHLAGTVRVADLARHVGLSLSAFARTYPTLAGETPYRTVARLRIEAVKRRLLRDGLSVKEAAHRLGYSSEFQLSRAFKRFEGLSPSHYVRAMTEKAGNGRSPHRSTVPPMRWRSQS